MPETALFLEWLKDKPAEDYLFPLSDHPKPANEYHLKTGQRERRLGH